MAYLLQCLLEECQMENLKIFKDKKILNRKSNYFYYFSLVINSVHGYIEEDRTVMDTFNILEESRIYNHRTTLDFIKNIMQDLLRKFN